MESKNNHPIEPARENGQERKNESKIIQGKYLDLVEEYLKRPFKYRPQKLESESQLEPIFDEENKPPAFIERIRALPERKTDKVKTREDGSVYYEHHYFLPQEGHQDLWLVVDFDDVLNKTTLYNEELKKNICSTTGMTPEDFRELYENSKQANQEGKKVFRFYSFIEEIEKRFPDKKNDIDNVLNNKINCEQFLDQATKRALLSLRVSGSLIRVSVLTFGDIKYQKERINKTDIKDVVEDVIYTEGSKRETLEKLIQKDYKSKGLIPPFVITVDDSPEQVDDFDNLDLKSNFVNMHFRNPQSKKFNENPDAEKVISVTENKPNEAAVNLYQIARLCLRNDMQLTRENVYNILQNQDNSKIFYETKEKEMGIPTFNENRPKNETNITYHQEPNGDIIRESDLITEKEIEHTKETIGKNGELLTLQNNDLLYNPINREEYIRGI